MNSTCARRGRAGVRRTRLRTPAHGLAVPRLAGWREVERDLPGDLGRERGRKQEVDVLCRDREPVDQAERVLSRPGIQLGSPRQAAGRDDTGQCLPPAQELLRQRRPRRGPRRSGACDHRMRLGQQVGRSARGVCDVTTQHLGQGVAIGAGAGGRRQGQQQPGAQRRGDMMLRADHGVQPGGVCRYAVSDLARAEGHTLQSAAQGGTHIGAVSVPGQAPAQHHGVPPAAPIHAEPARQS